MSSRIKLAALFGTMLAGLDMRQDIDPEQKLIISAQYNRQSGGALFGGSHIPGKLPNQRQRRKLARQTQRF